MKNNRVLAQFGLVAVVIIGGFWIALLWSKGYDQRLATLPAPRQSTPPPKEAVSSPPIKPQQTQPQAKDPSSQPPAATSPATAAATPAPQLPKVTPREIPRAGSTGLEYLFTAALIGMTIVLGATLRRQALILRSNR